MQEDEAFWEQLRGLPDRLEDRDQRAIVGEYLSDFDGFLAIEEHVFTEIAGLPRREATRLLGDVNEAVRDRDRALRMARSKLDEDTVDKLRGRSGELREAMRSARAGLSDVPDSAEPELAADPRRYRWSFDIRKSLLFVSGAAQVSINAFLLAPHPAATGSMITGAQCIIQQFPEGLLKSVGDGMKNQGRRLRGAWDSWMER